MQQTKITKTKTVKFIIKSVFGFSKIFEINLNTKDMNV